MIRYIVLFCMMPFMLWADSGLEKRIAQAREKVFPALVHVQPVKEIFRFGEKQKVQVTGSGVIFRPDGYVLTNNHVAEKARFVRCTLSSRVELEAEVVGLDPYTDLAVLKLNLEKAGLEKVPYAKLGSSDNLQVGQLVLALGSPLGLARSLSMGVISSVDRYFSDVGEMISPYNLWIQTDAAINPGNSGGPLVNMNGEVIGINARAVTFGENLGFAIPVNTAKYVVDQIMEHKEVMRSWIGITWQELREYREFKNLPSLKGVLVADIDKDSPAMEAGLRPGDVITAINGQPVSAVHREELPKIRLLVANIPIHTTITFDVLAEEMTRKVTLQTEKQGKFEGNEFQCDEWGFSVQEITPRIVKNFQLDSDKGVQVSGVRRGSKADEANLNRGYVILTIDDEPVENLDAFKKMYEEKLNDKMDSHMLFLTIGRRNLFALIEGDSGNDR